MDKTSIFCDFSVTKTRGGRGLSSAVIKVKIYFAFWMKMDEYILLVSHSECVFIGIIMPENAITLQSWTTYVKGIIRNRCKKFLECCKREEFRDRYLHPNCIWFSEQHDLISNIFAMKCSELFKYCFEICDKITEIRLFVSYESETKTKLGINIYTSELIIGGSKIYTNNFEDGIAMAKSLGFIADSTCKHTSLYIHMTKSREFQNPGNSKKC